MVTAGGWVPFQNFERQTQKVKGELVRWSKESFGDIFKKVATMEDIVRMKETQLEIDPSEINRANLRRVEAELRKFVKIEEDYWKQKVGMN